MTVRELILALEKIENKDLSVFLYDRDYGEISEVLNVDDTLTDRVDLNI